MFRKPINLRAFAYSPVHSPVKLARHTLFNLIGLGAPLLLALVSMPVLVRELGPDRFGLLTLIWAVTSYFGLFDLGLGRALTLQLSVALAHKRSEDVGTLCATALILMTGLASLAGLLLFALAPWGVGLIKNLPDRQEAITASYLMALAMPAVILTSGLRGMLEAKQAFGLLNLIRLPLGLWTFAGPWLVLWLLGPNLVAIAASLVLGRFVACAVHAWFAWKVLPEMQGDLRWQRAWLRPLCVSGGWMTLSNIVSPFMGYVDRFLLAGLVSAAAVAYYATPLEMVIKLSIFPAAITAVLFPSLAAMLAQPGAAIWPVCEKALLWLLLCMGLTAVPIALFAQPLLRWWLGEGFAEQSTLLLQMFCVGIAINCLAHIPLTLLQSADSARVTALIHCVELPLFLLLLWWLIDKLGVTGAALAWLLRMIVDTLLMFGASAIRFEAVRSHLLSLRLVTGFIALCIGFSALLFDLAWMHVIALLVMLGLMGVSLLPTRPAAMQRMSV